MSAPNAGTPVALTIAGSDTSAGAGIQADIKTFAALGVYGASVITALTAQNTVGITAIHDLPPPFVTQEIDAVYSDLAPMATKIGMLSRAGIVVAVAEGLRRWQAPNVVLDPVLVASSGRRLLAPDAIDALRQDLLPLARIVTPNLDEAGMLTGTQPAMDEAAMASQAEAILRLGVRAVLVKGGHGSGSESIDILADAEGVTRFAAPRIATRNSHGTGCTLSAAIAACLAKGADLRTAVAQAKAYLTEALEGADRLEIGAGAGPLDHFGKRLTSPSGR